MSTVLHRREVNIAITAAEAGREFANASCDVQVDFLCGFLEAACDMYSWEMQCRYIADEMPHGERRTLLAVMLGTLVEHLLESKAENAT